MRIRNDFLEIPVVQNIGSSTTDVISQKGTTDLLFSQQNNKKVQIGYNSDASSASDSGVAIGNTSKINGDNGISIGTSANSYERSVAIGKNAVAKAEPYDIQGQLDYSSVAIGDDTYAEGGSVVIGHGAKTSTYLGIAIGSNSFAEGNTLPGAIAIGNNAKATYLDSVAIGSGSETNYPHSVSVGSFMNERKLTNVAIGNTSNDAIIKAQHDHHIIIASFEHFYTSGNSSSYTFPDGFVSNYGLIVGTRLKVTFHVANGNSPTLNVSNTGQNIITYRDTGISANYIPTNAELILCYTGQWRIEIVQPPIMYPDATSAQTASSFFTSILCVYNGGAYYQGVKVSGS